MTREELEPFIQDMDTWYGLRWNRDAFWRRVFGDGNQRLPALREGLAELVRRGQAGLTVADFRELHAALPGFGPAYLSEVLALRFPDHYWLWNKQIRGFFEAHGVDVKSELRWGKKGDIGEEYMAAGHHLADLRRALTEVAGRPVDQLVTDQFVYWANQQERPDPWAERIARLIAEHFPPERAQVRQEGEAQARQILHSEVQVVQFHPSYAYEEFVEGIRPQSLTAPDGRHELTYSVKKGIFRRFCEQARAYPKRRYVLILDEINRGELPRILGELLFLLEYRQESVVLPYSDEPFSIPENLFLIGTMNTADRSIALVDHALRRRFHFVPMRADPDVLRAFIESSGNEDTAWIADLLELANHQLAQDGIDWHLHIGHSHFMRPDLNEVGLRLIWKHSVLPTLEEYFYRQPERLQAYQLDTLRQALGKA